MLFDLLITNRVIDFAPDSEAKEILQNVLTICSTLKGSVPLDREFGVDPAMIDEPVNVARAKVSAQFIDAIRRFEPRAEPVRVAFREGEMHEVLPVVTLRVRDKD